MEGKTNRTRQVSLLSSTWVRRAITTLNIALIFDFDDTLVPDSATQLLNERGVKTEGEDGFWLGPVNKLIGEGYDPTHAYLRAILDLVGEGKPLGKLTNDGLREFGKKLDGRFFPGIPGIFDDITNEVTRYRDTFVEYYIISGGLQAIIEGSGVVQKYFPGRVYGCMLGSTEPSGVLNSIKRAITFTEKTRYLFEINKGITPAQVAKKSYIVNEEVPHAKRRIPLGNMIYVGDGLTDIPCFSLLKNGVGEPRGGGIPLAVFDPRDKEKARRVLQQLLLPGRVIGAHAPDFGEGAALGSLIRASVRKIISDVNLEDAEP